MQNYTFIRDGKSEEVSLVRWRWIVHYKDGTVFKQYDDKGIFHQFKEIDQKKGVAFFQMVSKKNPNGIKLAIPETADLIHFYTNVRPAGSTKWVRSFSFGWKVLVGGKLFKRLLQIRPDDSVEILDDDGRSAFG